MNYDLIELVAEGIFFIFSLGVVYAGIQATLKNLTASVDRLEKKVEKHNNFDRRIIKLETMLEMQGIKEQVK